MRGLSRQVGAPEKEATMPTMCPEVFHDQRQEFASLSLISSECNVFQGILEGLTEVASSPGELAPASQPMSSLHFA